MMIFNKLVRDRIPEIMAQRGLEPVVEVLDAAAYQDELHRKLHEEVAEFEASGTAEELADILEVVYALAAAQNLTEDQLNTIRSQKRQERGGFNQRLFLISVAEEKTHD